MGEMSTSRGSMSADIERESDLSYSIVGHVVSSLVCAAAFTMTDSGLRLILPKLDDPFVTQDISRARVTHPICRPYWSWATVNTRMPPIPWLSLKATRTIRN